MAKTLGDIYKTYNIAPNANFYTFSLNFMADHGFLGFLAKKAEQTYLNLSFLLNYIENNQNIFIAESGKPIDKFLKFDIDDDNFMVTYENQVSSDPRICLIPNNAQRYSNIVIPEDSKTRIEEICSKFLSSNNPYVGRVMYLLINVEYIVKILFELKDDKGQVILDTFLRRLLDDINSSLGGINKLTYKIFDNNRVTIIEEASLKYDNLKPKTEYAKFNVYGLDSTVGGSFVKNIDFNVTITNDFATSIAIGAQANGNQPGQNSTALSTFNSGLIDRNAKIRLTDNSDNLEDELSEPSPEEKFIELKKKYDKAVEDMYGKEGKVNDTTVSAIFSLNKDIAQAIIGKASEKDKVIPAPSFLPFDLNVSMKGLTGMKIFERFALSSQSEKILPSTYRDNNGKSLIDFIITDIKHSIKDNVWDTQIKGTTVPSENNLEPITSESQPSSSIIDVCPKISENKEKALLDFVSRNEGGYTSISGGGKPPQLTSQTIGYILNVLQPQMNNASRGEKILSWGNKKYNNVSSTAVGKYQFIEQTLREALNQSEYNENTKFTPKVQDNLILSILKNSRGLDNFLAGNLSVQQFGQNLAKEFASLPVLAPINNKSRGQSYYSGVGNNKALISADDFQKFLEQLNPDAPLGNLTSLCKK